MATKRIHPGRTQLEHIVLELLAALRRKMRVLLRAGKDARGDAELYHVAARFMRFGRLEDARITLQSRRVPKTALRVVNEQNDRAQTKVIKLADARRQRRRAPG